LQVWSPPGAVALLQVSPVGHWEFTAHFVVVVEEQVPGNVQVWEGGGTQESPGATQPALVRHLMVGFRVQ
jgi:hypothetical protein